jgi:hypothetical protein
MASFAAARESTPVKRKKVNSAEADKRAQTRNENKANFALFALHLNSDVTGMIANLNCSKHGLF